MTNAKQSEEIEALIAQFHALNLRELHLRFGDLEIYLSTDANGPSLGGMVPVPAAGPDSTAVRAAGAPAPRAAPASISAASASMSAVPTPMPAASAPIGSNPNRTTTAASTAASPASIEQDLPAGASIVTAPYLGTFYRAPKPGAPSFVEVGSSVVAGTDLCLVEVMKLFTTLRAEAPGTVHAILARDGELVAAEQPLFVVVPA